MAQQSWLHDKQKRKKWLAFMQSLNPDIDPQAIRLMDELSFAARAMHHVRELSIDEAELSFAQYRVLMHLFFAENMGDRSELNPSEISERQGVSRNTMSALIRNLEEEGLVERSLDPDDRRRFNIRLTPAGREIVTQNVYHHLEIISQCFTVLTPDEQKTMLRLLAKISANLTAVREQC